MKTFQTILLTLAVVLLVLGGVYCYTSKNKQIESDADTKSVPSVSTRELKNSDIVWSYEDMGTDYNLVPDPLVEEIKNNICISYIFPTILFTWVIR